MTRRWTEYLKDYDIMILYHPDKANVVGDALSGKSICLVVPLIVRECWLHEQLSDLNEN